MAFVCPLLRGGREFETRTVVSLYEKQQETWPNLASMQRAWRWIGRGADLSSLIAIALLIPTFIGLVVAGLWYFKRSPTQALTLGAVTYAVLQDGLAAVALVARIRANRRPNIEVQPTG